MARVYADVNQNMPRSYWDYDSVNISECSTAFIDHALCLSFRPDHAVLPAKRFIAACPDV